MPVRYCPRCGESLHQHGTRKGGARKGQPRGARLAYDDLPKKRKPSAYNKKYAAAFKKVKGRYMKKGGGWKKDGFKRAGAAARRMIK